MGKRTSLRMGRSRRPGSKVGALYNRKCKLSNSGLRITVTIPNFRRKAKAKTMSLKPAKISLTIPKYRCRKTKTVRFRTVSRTEMAVALFKNEESSSRRSRKVPSRNRRGSSRSRDRKSRRREKSSSKSRKRSRESGKTSSKSRKRSRESEKSSKSRKVSRESEKSSSKLEKSCSKDRTPEKTSSRKAKTRSESNKNSPTKEKTVQNSSTKEKTEQSSSSKEHNEETPSGKGESSQTSSKTIDHLSSPDVPLPVVLEPLVRTTPGLQKASPRYLGRSPSDKTNKYRKKYQRSGQTKSKKLKKSAANLLSMKYKTRYTERASSPAKAAGGKRRADSTRGLSRAELRKRKKLKLAMKRDRRSTPASRAGSTQASPRDSPLPSGHRDVKNWLKKKPETTSYDIDNIVIPHSIAASTRVEKLEYKEIITPKWRLKPVEPITSLSIHEEDLTDDMFASRHVICEVREKQRYLHFVTSGRKKGGSMRAESGANTPDPFSTADEGPTPPVTPSPVEARRRSSSVTRSRAQSMCETTTPTSRTSCATPDPEEVAGPFIPAWEPRKFPLSEAQYQVLVKEKQTAKSPSKRQRKTVTYYDEYVESGQTSVATTPGSSRMASPMSTDNEDEGEAAELLASDPEWDDNEEED